MTEPFDRWLEREYRYAATAMLRSVSRVDLVRTRPGFGQTVRPVAGAIVASPVPGAYDPDPDYFFHWYRDSAVVIDALRLLYANGDVGAEALAHVADFVRFSASLRTLDGRALVAQPSWRRKVSEDHLRFLRDDADLAAAHGDAVAAEARVNPHGTLDISRWNRPQHDGAPLRALALLRWVRAAAFDAGVRDEMSTLIRADLARTFRHWHEPSYDIWEEDMGSHYYTLCVSAAALDEGADWLHTGGDQSAARSYRTEAGTIRRRLDEFWLADEGYYRSRIMVSGRSVKELDIAVILAAIHAASTGASHSARDPRMHASLMRLDALFAATYPINRNRCSLRGTAMGRYPGDTYYSGGAYYFSTLGAAEFCFRAAAAAQDRHAWVERGDAYLATVRAHTPAGGELSEQFDQDTGAQTSAKHLAWSYAAFISCCATRRNVV